MTVAELIKRLQAYDTAAEVAVETDLGLVGIKYLDLHDEKVRYLEDEYAGDYHSPSTFGSDEYSQSRGVKALVVFR